MSRKEKKEKKRRESEAARAFDNLESIGDIGDFEELNKLVKLQKSSKNNMDVDNDGYDNRENDSVKGEDSSNDKFFNKSSGNALERALAVLKKSSQDDSGSTQQSRRRPAPSFDENNDDINDNENNLLEEFTKRKKKYLALKDEHYKAEPRFGGYEESVSEGDKRAASYEIIKNRGLTPHRSKINSNARVKKRVKYNKALIRQKGQQRSVRVGEDGSYAGEFSGIKADISRSRKF